MHLCQFYQSKQELIDILVPYIKAGLENNELCFWIAAEPLRADEARAELAKALPDIDRYMAEGQMEIIPHTEWYLKDGLFDVQRVFGGWARKLELVQKRKYDGIRGTGNVGWLEKRDWKKFIQYEHEVNAAIGKYRTLAVCTYPLVTCGISEVLDVVDEHQFALIRRGGEWVRLRSFDHGLQQCGDSASNTIPLHAPIPMMLVNPDGSIVSVNPALETLSGFSWQELVGRKTPYPWWPGIGMRQYNRDFLRLMRRECIGYEAPFLRKDGEWRWVEINSTPVAKNERVQCYLSIWTDITEQKQTKQRTDIYARQITRVHEEELKRASGKLVDGTAQSLAALCLNIDMLIRTTEQPSEVTDHDLREIRSDIASILRDIRSLSNELWFGELEILGWRKGFELLIAELNNNGIKARLLVTGAERAVSADTAMILFRAVQEALRNIRQWSKATRAVVNVRFTPRKIRVTISDNGRGFELPDPLTNLASQDKFGLLTMEERLRLEGGTFSIESSVGRGTKVTLELEE